MSRLRGWEMHEVYGMSIPNPRGCVRVTGPPEFLEAFVEAMKKEHPEWFDEDELDVELA